jgi:hypothetical protein
MNAEEVVRRPKCAAVSGDDWSQCIGACPMPMSPHYKVSAAPPLMEVLPLAEDAGNEDDYLPPPYGKPGWLLVEVGERLPKDNGYKHEYEVHDFDPDSGVFWIREGVGFDYWLNDMCDFPAPGFYVIEGIRGSYIKGDWGFTDDDEEWEFKLIRPATPREIETKTLDVPTAILAESAQATA